MFPVILWYYNISASYSEEDKWPQCASCALIVEVFEIRPHTHFWCWIWQFWELWVAHRRECASGETVGRISCCQVLKLNNHKKTKELSHVRPNYRTFQLQTAAKNEFAAYVLEECAAFHNMATTSPRWLQWSPTTSQCIFYGGFESVYRACGVLLHMWKSAVDSLLWHQKMCFLSPTMLQECNTKSV